MGNLSKMGSTSVKPTGSDVPDIAAAYANGWKSMMGDSIALWVHAMFILLLTTGLTVRVLYAIRAAILKRIPGLIRSY